MSEDRFCEGCGVAFDGDERGPIHVTDYCRDLWERKRLLAVVEAARNVVASTRGDISRKPHVGRLRDSLAAWDATQRHTEEP